MKNPAFQSEYRDFFTQKDQRSYVLVKDHLVFLPKYLVR